ALAAGIDQIRALAEPERLAVVAAYRDAISTTFLMGIGIIGLAFLLVFLLPELPLRSGKPAE
ncbi:MAG: MFS transporter, partial [Ferrovibrionaceae bacterium]